MFPNSGMTNFLLTVIVVLIVGNQAWRLIKKEDERPNDMGGELFIAYAICICSYSGYRVGRVIRPTCFH